jgi:septal ring factor EnvC (AmiA/AmiB activator)
MQQPPEDMSPGEVHQLFDAMLAMQAQNALSLDDQQYAQFLRRLRALQEARRRNQQERVRLINELQRMTTPRNPKPPAESEVKLRLNALQELESRSAADLRRAYDSLDEVLTPLQQARFRVLEEQIERRKLELVGRARQNNMKRPNPR